MVAAAKIRGFGHPKRIEGFHERQKLEKQFHSALMSGPGLARAVQRAHQERKIAGRCLNQELLVHIVAPSRVEPVQASGVELMREVALHPLTTLPLQSLAAIAPYPTPVAIDSLLLRLSVVPVTRTPIGFGDVAPHFQFR